MSKQYETPILLITFNRPEHTNQTIEALKIQKPPLLYVFQDGPRENNLNDLENCEKVRDIVLTKINWKCELITYFSDKNRGCRDAIIFAITKVLSMHDSVIVLEDDIITSPAFYSYMTKALDYYKDKKTVFSISGHSHSPIKFQVPENYDYDVYVSPRLFNWGWGTWRDRWEQTDWTMSYVSELLKHPYECDAFNRGGEDLMIMLIEEYEGKSSAWDVQFAFSHFCNHAISIVPCISYTHNIGLDGSGTHCVNSNVKIVDYSLLNQTINPKFIDNLYLDKRIMNLIFSAFLRKKRPLWQKIINRISRMLGGKNVFVIKKKIYA